MIRTILVPLDGSPIAEQALTAAHRVALETGATLLLARATLFFAVDQSVQPAERLALREAKAYLQRVQRDLIREGFNVQTTVLPCDPIRAILFAAEAHGADLICMSTHGHSGLRHVLLGSVAEAVMGRSITPVVLTRAVEHSSPRTTTPYGRVLVPLDGTALAEAALAYLAGAHLGRAAELLLLQVVAPVVPTIMATMAGEVVTQLYKQADDETEQRRLRAVQYLTTTGNAFPTEIRWRTQVALGSPAREILAVAEAENSELIVMPTHGRHGLDRLLRGSVVADVLHGTTAPMLILHGAPDATPV